MTSEETEKRWKEMIDNIVREQIRKLIKIDFTCPYCGKKYTIEELGKWEEGDLTNGGAMTDKKENPAKNVKAPPLPVKQTEGTPHWLIWAAIGLWSLIMFSFVLAAVM